MSISVAVNNGHSFTVFYDVYFGKTTGFCDILKMSEEFVIKFIK